MKRIFYFFFLFFINSQLSAQIDNNFWFVAPEVAQNHGDRPINLRISTMADTANIVFRMPASLSFVPITQKILPNSSFTIVLTPWIDSIENKPADRVLTRGLLLTSDKNVTSYYEVSNASNPAVSSLKGKNGLGTEFYISGQTDYPNQTNDGSEAFDIVATEDSTHVWITPTLPITGHAAGITFQITLNKGQTYSARTTDVSAPASLKGSHVVSDKPIAITIMDDSIITGGWDEIADQTIPINILGWDYIVIKGFADNVAGNNDEHVYILATKDNTDIYLDGNAVPAATLNTGAQYNYVIPPANNTVRIKATNPVYVYHLSGHAGEAGSAIIPQDSCTGSRQVGFTRTTNNQFALLILTRSGNEGSFSLNGNNGIILASDFTVVPGTSGAWMYYRKNNLAIGQVPVGANQIVNSSGKFHLGILNMGSGGSSEYGYFSDFSSLYLGADKNLCPGDSLTLDGGLDRASYEWKKIITGSWVTIGTNRFLVVHDSGYYAVMTNGDFCELRDTIHIGLYPAPIVNLGPDTTLCEGASITLDPGQFISYRWQNGFIGRLFPVSTAGTYWVEVTNNNGCKAIDTIVVVTDSLPKSTGIITGSQTVCPGLNNVIYSVPPFPYASTYSWTLPPGASGASTTNSITVNYSLAAASDTIRVKGVNACGTGPELKKRITVAPLPVPVIGGTTSPCAGSTGNIYSTAAGMSNYTWTVSAGGSITSPPGTNTITVTWNTPGAQSVSVNYNDLIGCAALTPTVYPVTVNSLPVPPVGGPAAVCLNSSGTYSTDPGMSNYLWTVSAGGSITSAPGANTIDVFWSTTGSKTITVNYTDANGCTANPVSSYTVTVNTLPVPALTGLLTICSGNSTTYSTDAGMSNYIW
ncbi:MAG: hypothetical protein NTW10_06050, partial [Bacteroidetes bacterium]|nr:hypothetical protein [Bacteroidota bacterium]